MVFAGVGVLLLVRTSLHSPRGQYNICIFQAAKDVRAGQEILVNIFERVENFFRRLSVYTNVPPTTEMMEMIIQIMVEVLSILGIATKEIKQSRMSEQFTSAMSPLTHLTERRSEKYGKKLVGRTDLEDALKRLDRLTQEEARMAAAEVLRATHIIDERVRGVSKQVLVVEDRMASVDDKVAEVIDGAQIIFSQARNVQPELPRWKRSKGSHGTNCQRCRSFKAFVILLLFGTDYGDGVSYCTASLQKTNCGTISTNGSLHRIHQRTIT